MSFQLQTHLTPAGDQPQAIDKLVTNLQNNINKQVLLGVTGSGKTFTVANVINKTQLPTLIISHNKTLAGQLYQEFKELFPHNKVSYFVSYYDYYQPESYLPASDTYIAKEVEINDLIDKLRLEATSNLFEGNDNIVIASVSCIYNIGDPRDFSGKTIDFNLHSAYPRRQLFENLVSLFYSRSEVEFKRGQFRVRGENVEIWPSYADWVLVLEFNSNDQLVTITQRNPFSGHEFSHQSYRLYPAKQFVSGVSDKEVFAKIEADCQQQIELFRSQGKVLEAHRIRQRVDYDLEMLSELGYVNGIENYSIYFENHRHPGDPPYTLIDYFRHLWGDNFLTIIDESHVTVPQIGGMYQGDLSRKKTLVDFGFRLPSAYDNRPLKWSEFYSKVKKIIYLSATPSEFEIKDSDHTVVEQIIRPTGLVDPPIDIRPTTNQIPDLEQEITARVNQNQRTLVVTLTKKMAEELAEFLSKEFKVAYLHADVDTLKRSDILDKLRAGDYDVLVGINLLREGLDLPEVSLVAILDASQAGFLRSRSSLIQIMGRASRHVDGRVILYADNISPAIHQAVTEVNRRRRLQLEYNQQHHITPVSVNKTLRPKIIEVVEKIKPDIVSIDPQSLTPNQRKSYISKLKKQMRALATDLNFEEAIRLRDRIKEVENM